MAFGEVNVKGMLFLACAVVMVSKRASAVEVPDSRVSIGDFHWPLNNITNAKLNETALNKIAVAYGNVEDEDGYVTLSDSKAHIYVEQDFAAQCITNPNFCPHGLTVAFWVRFPDALPSADSVNYIITSGAEVYNSTGFVLYRSNDLYVVTIRGSDLLWNVSATFSTSAWSQVAFTWKISSGVKLYKDGTLQASSNNKIGVDGVQGQDSRLYIGVSGSVPSAGAPSLSIHSLTIWHQELELDTINKYMSSAQVAFGPDPSGLSPSWSSNYYNSETPTIGTGPARSVQDPQTFGVYYYVNFTYSQPISLSIPISLGELGAWTLCWFQRISLPKDEQNILLMSAGNGVTITFSMKTSLLISFTSERDNEKKTLDDLTSDSWNHICLLRDVDSTFTVYLDGTRQDISLKKSESYVLVPTITLLLSDGSAGNRFMGDLTRLNMWNHVLTADQIKALGSCSLVEGNVIRWSEVLDSALRDRANELWSSYQCTQDYWFLEASNGNDPYVSKPFRLVSGEIPPHVDCLHFDYSMEGSDMGRLKVRLEQQDGARSLLWSITGSQASGWHAESLRIANITGSKLVFEGIPGGVKSDMAIDRIILSKDSKCPLSTYSGIKGIRSNILDHHPTRKIELQSLIAKATGTSEFWEPCFSLSREGWPSVESIYTKCADKGPILLLVRYNQDYVVGGFYDKSMKGYGRCNSSMTSDKAFLFSLNSHLGTTQKVLPIYDKTKAIICEDVNNFPRFGSDLMVNFETNRLALHFGQIYKGEDIQYGQSEQMFRPDDVEILINSEAFCADCPSGMECNSLKGRCECENSRFFQKCSQGQGIDYFTGTAVDVYPLDQPTDIVNFKRFAWGSASGVKQVKKAVRGGGLSTPGGSSLTLNTSECLGNPESCKKGITIAFWLRYNRTQSSIRAVLLCAGTCSEGSQGIKIYLKNPEEIVVQVTNSKTLYRQSIEFGVGVWTHLVITIDPSTGNIVYVNGRVQFGNIEEFEGVYTLQDEAANVTLGGSAQADFDDFLVYESVLSPEDTAHLYAFYSGRNVSRLKIKIEIAYTYGQWSLPENDGLPKISEQQLAEFGVTQDKINALYGGENGVQGNPPKVLDTNVMSSPGNDNTLVALMLEFSPAGYEAARGFIHHIETNKTLNSLYDILNVISIAFDNVYYKPVSILSVTASGNSANISWTAFHDTAHNGLYQGFKIELYNGSAVVLDHRSAEWSTNVTGLRPFTNYTARVAPFTLEGVGNWSETVSFTTPDLPPEVAPDGLTAHALSPSAVRVSWNRLESVAFNVLAYWVVYSGTGRAGSLLTDIKIIAGASSNTIDIGNLKASTSYSIGVQAVSTLPGPASDPVNVTTLDGAPSAGPPTSAHVVNGTALRVEWGEIPEASRNGRITGYDIACKENISSTIVVSERVHANRTSVVIDGLDYDTVYKVTVSGRTSGGPGNATLVLARTQYGVPSIAPRNVAVVDTNSTAIRLSWDSLTRKEARGPPVGYYIALLSLNNSHVEEFTVMLSSACGSTVVVQDLRPVTMYLIQVAGFTIQGAGPLANLNVTTAEAEPTLSPNITLISASPYGITIGWTPLPVHVLQGYVRAYIVEYSGTGANVSNGSAHASASATRITLLGLRFKSLYSIRMKVLTITEAPFSNTLMANTTEAAPPVCPRNVGTEYITETQVNITWQSIPQDEAGGEILGHVLTYVLANSSDSHRTIQVNGSQMFYLLDGLRKYTSYLVTLAAFTSTGKGKNCSLIVKTAEGKPAADVNVTISSVNTSAIVIALGAVEGNVNGALRGYVLTLYDTLRNVNITVYTCAGSGDLSLNDLFPYTPYKVLVGVFNNDDLGNSSEAASFRTLEAAPSKPPRNVTAKNSSSTTLTLTWSPPDEFYLNGILQGYRVFWQKTFESNPVVHNMTVPTSDPEDQVSTRRRRRAVTPCCGQVTLVLDGLQPYTMYTIRILAFTVADGEFVAINATTNEDVPSSPPLNVTLTANDTSINVTWQPIPEKNTNGDLLGYHVFYQESHTGNSTPCLVTVDRSSLAVQLLNLTPYTGYLVSVAGFTAPGTGEVSTMMSINTSEIRPGAAPTSIGGSGISTSSVSVTWQPVPLNKQFGRILGYKILLWNVTFQMNVSLVGEDVLSHVVSGLYTLTSYNVSLLAYNRMGEGPWSQSIVLTTLNKVLSGPNVTGFSLDGNSMTLDIVSSEGLVLGYTVAYYPVGSPYSLRERFFGPNATSFKLPALDPKTDYTVLLTVAFLGGLTATTNLTLNSGIEGAMEAVPGSVKSVSRQSVDSIPISWAPVPSTPQGPILGYNVRYQLISLGDEPVKDQPIHEINVTGTFLNLTNLEAFGSYRISVAAMNKKGIGPEIYFNAETCRCRKRLTTNWRAYVPYTDKSGLNGEPEGIIASVIREMSVSCCETCNTHGPSYVDFNSSWDYTGPAEVDNETVLIDRISEHVDLTFPVYGTRDKTVYKPGFGFRALVESPGIAYVVRVDHNIPPYKLIVDSLINTLPFLAMTLLMAYIAGFVIWIMDRRQNMDEFPLSFIKGTYEGCWWAFITMTTLGYGDRVPRSRLAKACTIVWMLMGIVVFGILSGCLQSAVASITMKINSQLYGIKVLAIHNSPEYRLGIRLNSQVNTDVQPKNFKELFNALMAQKDNGALIDAYAIGSQKKLFQNPELTIARILDLKIAYGIVLGGTSVRMKKCFYEYIHEHNEQIFARIRKYVKNVEEAGNLPDSVEYSTGMFDAGTEMFRWTLYTLLGVLFVLLLIGITWERVWHIPRRKAIKESVEAQECTRAASEALKKEIELLLERMRAVRTRLCKKHANQTVAFLKKHKNKLLSLRMPERQARIENKFSALDKAHMKPKIGDFVF